MRAELAYEETPIEGLSYSLGKDVEGMLLRNAIATSHGIVMKSSSEKGSVVSFRSKNPADEWSFSFTFTKPDFFPPQFAGIYLWYTDPKVEEGDFKGAVSSFDGMMAGIEFSGKSAELVLSSNDGHLASNDVDDLVVFKDSVNYKRLRDVRELSVKIVSTRKNFRIELYSGGKLLYDNLRFKEADGLGDRLAGKYFSLTSHYQNVPHDKKFVLKDAILNKRQEHDIYDPLESKSPAVDAEPRMLDEVMHSSQDTRYLISGLEHYIEYIKTIIGSPAGKPIVNAAGEIRQDAEIQLRKMRNLVEYLDNNVAENNIESVEDVILRISDAKMKLSGMKTGLENVNRLLENVSRSNARRLRILVGSIFVLSGLAAFLLVLEKCSKAKK